MNTSGTLADNRIVRYMILVLVSLVCVSAYLSLEGLFAMEVTVQDPEGLYRIGDAEYGALSGAYSLLVVFGGVLLLGGPFIDRFGLRISGIISTALLIVGACFVVYSMSELRSMVQIGRSIPVIQLWGQAIRLPILYGIIGFSLLGAGSELIGVILTKVLSKWFKEKELAFALASQIAIGRLGIGATYGGTPYLLALFRGNVSMPLIIGVGLLVIGLLLYFVYCIYDRRLDAQLGPEGASSASPEESDRFRWADLATIAHSKAFWAICLICGCYYGAVRKFDNYSVGLVVERFDILEKTGGILPMVTSLTIVVLSPLLGIVVDKYGKSMVFLVGGSLLAVFDFILLETVLLPKFLVYAVFVLNGISFSLVAASLWPLVPRILPLSIQGTGYATVFLFQNIVFLIVPRLVTAVGTETHHYVIVFLSFAILSAVVSVLFYFLDRKNGGELNQPESKGITQ